MRERAAVRRAGAPAVAALVLLGACAPRNNLSRGLFEHTLGLGETLAPSGDIGIEPPTPWLRQLDLPSGLRVGFEAAHTRGMVGVVLTVGEGSTSDPPGKEGLAHLVEHLVFHARFDGRQVSETLARIGATYNADTGLDRTLYYMFAPAAALPTLLRLVEQRLWRPLEGVDRAAFAVERDIVENELRQRNETAVYGQVGAWLQAALFPRDHPYARSVGGSVETLRRLTLEDARAFVRQGGYAPPNASLLIVGDFDPNAAAAAVGEDFPATLRGDVRVPHAPIMTPRQAAPPYPPPPAPPPGYSVMRAPVAWPEIWLGYYLADMYSPYAPIMKVLTTSLVARTLRAKLGDDPDVADVDIETSMFRQATVLACRITLLSGERRQEIADKAREVMASLWRPSSASLWDAPRLALADAILEAEPFTGRAVARAEFFHMTGALNAYDALIEAVAQLQTQAVVEHGVFALAASNARVLFVEPLADDSRPPPGPVGVPTVANRRLLADAPALGSDFGDPPPAAPAEELRGARTFALPSGLRVVLLRRPQFPAVTALLGFRGGTGASPPGVVELLRLLEHEGTFELRRNALTIHKVDGPDVTADMVVAGRRNLSNALLMLAVRLRALDRVRWGEVMSEVRKSTRPSHESPAKKATRGFWRALYGEHAYGRVLGADELRQVHPEAVEGWLPNLYNPRNGTLVLVGDFSMDGAEYLINRWFGGWSGVERAGPVDVPPVPDPPVRGTAERVLVTHRPIGSQVEMLLGCRLPAGSDPRSYAAARMLVGVVVGQLRSRLREEAGAAYSVSGTAQVLRGGGAHLLVEASLDSRRLAEALRVLRGHWSHFGRGEFDRGTLSQVRWELVEAENLSYQTSAETAVRVLDAANHDWGAEALTALPDLYRDVGRADLTRLFATCRSSTVLSLLGDEPTIRAALGESAPLQAAR